MPRTRRNFTAEFKAKVVLEIISGNKSAAEVGRLIGGFVRLFSNLNSKPVMIVTPIGSA